MFDLTQENKYSFFVGEVEMKVYNIDFLERIKTDTFKGYDELLIQFYSPYGQCELKVDCAEFIIVEKQDKIVIKTVQNKILELFYN